MIPILECDTGAIGEELTNLDRIMHHLNGGEPSVGHDQSSGLFELESGNSISYNRVVRQFQRSEAVEEFFVLRSQERQICLVIHHLYRCRDLFAGFGAFQFNIILVSNQIGGNENATLRKNSP